MTLARRRHLLLFFAGLSAVGWVLYPSQYFRGRVLSQQPERDAAIAYFKDYLARHPRHKGALLALSSVYESVAEPEKGVAMLKDLYAHRRGDETIGQALLDLLERSGDLDGALAFRWTLFTDLERRAEAPHAVLEGLLYEYYERAVVAQDDPAILRALEALARTAKNKESYRFAIVRHLVSRGRRDEAARILTERLRSEPKDLDSRESLIYLLLARGDKPAALAEIEAGLAAKPDHPDFLYSRATLLDSLGRCEDSLRDFKRLAALKPLETQYRLDLVQAAFRCRPFEEASALASALLDRNPKDRRLWLTLIYQHSDKGRHDAAAALLERYRARYPDDPEAAELLAFQYEKLGSKGKAADVLADAHARRPEDQELARKAALALIAAGRFEAAAPILELTLRRAPGERELWWALIYGYSDRKRFWPAAAALERYLRLFPDDSKAYDALSEVFVQLDRKDKAIAVLEAYFSKGAKPLPAPARP